MKKMIALSICLLVSFVYLFFLDRDKIVVFSCPEDCEIGMSGQFVEIEFINQLFLPIVFEKTDSFKGLQLESIQSLSDDLDLETKASLGSWRMESCIVHYNKFGFIDDIYILGNSGYYFHSVYHEVSVTSKRELKVIDLIKQSSII